MRKLNALIAGSTGYIGVQLINLLIKHKYVNIRYLCGNTSVGKKISYFDNKLKSKNIGVLITDHNVRETLDIVDRAYILFNGSLIMTGTPSQVKADRRVRDVYLGNSFF
jgi:N-acetyl-gamma-glutamylphosphate reductase